jgi:hypothetical protein
LSQAVTRLSSIMELRVSTLDQDAGYPVLDFSCFTSVPPENAGTQLILSKLLRYIKQIFQDMESEVQRMSLTF